MWMIQLLNTPCSSFDLWGAKSSRLTQNLQSECSCLSPGSVLCSLQGYLIPLGIILLYVFQSQWAVCPWGMSKQGHPVLELLTDLTLVFTVESDTTNRVETPPFDNHSNLHLWSPQAENSIRGGEGAGDDHTGASHSLDPLRDHGHRSSSLDGAPDSC